jgi:endonuclease YncB( thermonuclease family)
VYDGDTITIASKIPSSNNPTIYKFSIRLKGIDAPEMKAKNTEEKEMAIKARDALSDRILGKDIALKNIEKEKYGRILCDIYLRNENIGQWMIDQRFAVAYDGKKKAIPKSWKDYHETNQM